MSRPRKSAEQHAAEGTYRGDRHSQPAIDIPVAQGSIVPSPRIPKTVVSEWVETTRRLVGLGILIDADIPLLESAFVLLADARYFHELLETAQKDIEKVAKMKKTKDLTAADIAKIRASTIDSLVSLNGMHIKALSLYTSIISRFGISPSERAKILHSLPKRPKDPERKSIKSVIKGK